MTEKLEEQLQKSVGILKPLIQPGSLPWNPLVGAMTREARKSIHE